MADHTFTITRKVEFSETDMAGLVHFSNFFRYMESAEHAFLDSLKIPTFTQNGSDFTGWPRVRAQCKYVAPLRFPDKFNIHLKIAELTPQSIRYRFRFEKIEETKAPSLIAKGEMTTLFAHFDVPKNSLSALSIPEDDWATLAALSETSLPSYSPDSKAVKEIEAAQI